MITSLPELMAVTLVVICPELLVTLEVGVKELLFCETRATVAPEMATPAESLTVMVSVVLAPKARELLPLMLIDVPVTSMLLVAVALSAVAENCPLVSP